MPSMQSPEIQYKASAGTFNLDEALGIVECFVAGIGNKDSVGDVCATGAFTKSLLRRKPRVVWGHNWNDPIGKVLDIYEVPASDPRLPIKMKMAGIGGLYAKVQFNLQSEKGKEAFANVAFFGEEQEWSIGYKTLRAQYDQNMQANILHEVELYEVSPVLHGANQLTGTISVKTDGTSQDVMERVVFPSGQMQEAINVRPLTAPVETPSPEDELLQKMVAELEKRTASKIKIVSLEKDSVIFDRQTSDGVVSKYKCGYHHDGREFMFGQPQRIVIQKPNINPPMMSPQQGQPSPQNRVTKPVPMMPMPVAIRPGQSGPVSIPLPVMVYEDSSNDKPKVSKPLDNEERALADALVRITKKYGKFNEDKKGVYAAYTPAAENELVDIGVKCSNCVFFKGEGSCRIIDKAVEADGRCRFAVIPPGVVGGTAMDKKDYNDFLDEQEVKWVEDIEEKYPGEFIFGVLRNTVKKRRKKRRKYKELNEFDAEEYAIKEKTLGNQEEKFFYIPVDVENLFEVKSLLDPVLDYHRVDSFVDEYGVVLTSGITEEFVDAVEIAVKGIGTRIGKRIGSGLIDRPRIGSGRKKNNNRLGSGRIDIPTGGTRGARRPTGTDKDIDRDGWVDEGTTNPRWVGMSSGVSNQPTPSGSGKPKKRTPIWERNRRPSPPIPSRLRELSDDKKPESRRTPPPAPSKPKPTKTPSAPPPRGKEKLSSGTLGRGGRLGSRPDDKEYRRERQRQIEKDRADGENATNPVGKPKKLSSGTRDITRHRSAKLLKNPAEDAKEADFEKIASSWREQGLGWVEIPRQPTAADKPARRTNDFLRGRELGYNQARVMWDGSGTYKRPANFNEKAKSSVDYRTWFLNTAKTAGEYMENSRKSSNTSEAEKEINFGIPEGIENFFDAVKPNVAGLSMNDKNEFFTALRQYGYVTGSDSDYGFRGGYVSPKAIEPKPSKKLSSGKVRTASEPRKPPKPPRAAKLMAVDTKNSNLAKKITYDPDNGDLTVTYNDGKVENFDEVMYDRVYKAGFDDDPDKLIRELLSDKNQNSSKLSSGRKLSSGAKTQIAENDEKIAELKEEIDREMRLATSPSVRGDAVFQNFLRQNLLDMSQELRLLEGKKKRLETESKRSSKKKNVKVPFPEAKPKRVSKQQRDDEKIYKRRNDGESLADVAESLGISRIEVRKREQRHMRRLREEDGERLSEDSNRSGEKLSSGGKWNGKKPTDKDIKPGADLSGADLRDRNLYGADLTEVNLSGANLDSAYLFEANLRNADLSGARMDSAFLEGAKLTGANLTGADLTVANLRLADLSNANLFEANLTQADLSKAKLSGANLRRANLFAADLRLTDLRNANLSGANLRGANLASADMDGANLRGADMDKKLSSGLKKPKTFREMMTESDRLRAQGIMSDSSLFDDEWQKTEYGIEINAPDIDGSYEIQGNAKDGFIVSRISDAVRNGGQDAKEYEHDKVFKSRAAAKKWAVRDYKLMSEEVGGGDVAEGELDDEKLSSGRKKKGKASKRKPFSPEDRQRFADGDRLRARTIPGKKKPGPSVDEFKLSSGYGGGSRQDRRNADLLRAQTQAREEDATIASQSDKKLAIEVIKNLQNGTPSPDKTYDDSTPKSERLKKIQKNLAENFKTPALVGTLADNKKRKSDGPWMVSFERLRPLLKNENNEPMSDAQIKFAFNLDDAELKKLTGKDGAISSAAVQGFMDAHGYPEMYGPGESSSAIRAIWGFDSSPYWYDTLEDNKLMNRDEYEAASNESGFLFNVYGLDSPLGEKYSGEPDVLPKKREVIAPAITKRSIEGTKGSDSQEIYAIDTLLESLGLKDKTPEEVAEAFTKLLGAKTTASQIFSSSKSWKNRGVPTNVTLQLKKNGHISSAKDVFQNNEAEALDRSVEQNKFYSALNALLKKNGIEINRGAGNISDGAMGEILGEAIGAKPLISVKRAFEKASGDAAGTFSHGVGQAIVWTPEEIQRTLDGVNKKTGKNFKIDDLKLSSGKFGKGERKISPRLSSGADKKFREINDQKIYDWDELSDNQKEDLIDLLGQKYVYEKLGLTDDAGIDAIDDGKYSEEIAEYTEDWYASTMRAFRKSGARGWQVNQQINKMDDKARKARVKKNPLDKMKDGERLSSGKLDEVYKSITQKLITAIEKADGDKWEAPWYKVGAFPKNPTNKNRPYSNTNLLFLLMAQEDKGYTKPYWATYKQWEKSGGQVRAGEKGTQILVPRVYKGKEDADGNKREGGVFYSVATVFNVDQVDGVNVEEMENKFPKLSEEQRVSQLESAIKEIGAKITEAVSDRAYYSPSKDEIVLPKFENFKSPLDFYATQAHELMHWTGHTSRLNRPNMNYFGSPEYAYEELVAEIASAFFMAAHGLSAEPQPQHAMYLASWLKRLKSDPDALQKAVSDAQKAVNFAIKLSPSMSKQMAVSENVDDVPGITVPETGGKLSSGKAPELPALTRALKNAGLAESVTENMITEALGIWKDNPSLHKQYIERLDGDVNGAVFSLYNDYLEDMFDRSPEGVAKIGRELNEQYEAERSLSSGRPSKRLSRRAKDNESSKLSSGKQPWDDSDVQKRLIDGARTKKKTKADGKTESFMASMVRQFDAGRKLNDNQWKPLWENFGKEISGESTGKPDAPSATKKIRTQFSGTKRKIIDLKDVEKYDYPNLPANRKPTVEQGAAIDAMMTGDDVKIQALAATGKTTTVINFAERLLEKEPESRILYLVFNRNAKDDVLERGMPDNVEVKTMDGVSYNAYRAMKPEITAKSFEKDPAYTKPIKSNKERASYLGARGLVSNGEELTAIDVYKRVSKAVDVFSISADGEIGPQHFSGLDNPKLEVTDETILPELVGLAQKMWADMNTPRVPNSNGQKGTGMLPMSNTHVTKMWALTSPDLSTSEGVNIAMVDEAQDMNPVFAELLKKANGLQRIYIGDTNQAINAWRGADGSTLDSAYAKHVMPITDSFRFGKEIADKGNRFLKLLGKKERMTGRKTDKSGNPVNGVVGPIDNPTMILTRSNGGAIVATLETFQNGGQVYGSKNFKNDLDSFINNIEYFETGAVGEPYWTNTNGERMSSPPKASKDLDGITNLAEFKKAVDDADNNRLNMLAKLLKENSIDELRAALKKIITDKKKLPKDRDSYVHIQTAHTSKGLESPRVKIWSDFRKPKRDGAGNLILPDEQELRLSYVAVTRAEEELDLGGLGWIMDYTSDTDGASDKLSSGANMLMPRLSGALSNALINSTPAARQMRKEWKKRESMSGHPSKKKNIKLSSGKILNFEQILSTDELNDNLEPIEPPYGNSYDPIHRNQVRYAVRRFKQTEPINDPPILRYGGESGRRSWDYGGRTKTYFWIEDTTTGQTPPWAQGIFYYRGHLIGRLQSHLNSLSEEEQAKLRKQYEENAKTFTRRTKDELKIPS